MTESIIATNLADSTTGTILLIREQCSPKYSPIPRIVQPPLARITTIAPPIGIGADGGGKRLGW